MPLGNKQTGNGHNLTRQRALCAQKIAECKVDVRTAHATAGESEKIVCGDAASAGSRYRPFRGVRSVPFSVPYGRGERPDIFGGEKAPRAP